MAGKQFDLSVIFRVLDKASKPIQKIGKSLTNNLARPVSKVIASFSALGRAIKSKMADVRKSIRAGGKDLKEFGNKLTGVGKDLALKLTAPILALGGISLASSIKFQSAFTGVRKTVDATEEELQKLKKGLLGLALEIPIDTTEFFKLGEVAGQLGIQTGNIKEFAKQMAILGVATTSITAEEAAVQLAQFAKVAGFSQKEFDRLVSTIVDLGNSTATNEGKIIDLALSLAGAGRQIGLSAQEMVAFAASIAETGENAEAGGSAFSRLFSKIASELGTGSDILKGFAKVSKKTMEDFEKDFRTKPAIAVIEFIEGLRGINEESKKLGKEAPTVFKVLDFLGLQDIRLTRALLKASGASESFRKNLVRGEKAFQENIAGVIELNKRLKDTAAQAKLAANRAEQTAVSYGDILKDAFDEVLKSLKPVLDFFKTLDKSTKILIIVIGLLVAAISPLLISLGLLATFMGTTLGATFTLLVAAMAPFIVSAVVIAGTALAIVANWKDIVFVFNELKDVLSDLLKGNFKPLTQLFTDINNFLSESAANIPILQQLVIGFTALGKVGDGVLNNWEPTEILFANLADSFRELRNLILPFGILGNEIVENWKPIKVLFQDISDIISDMVSGNFKPLSDFFSSIGGFLKPIIGGATKTSESVLSGSLRGANQPIPNNAELFNRNINESRTDINIKVSTENGAKATIERVEKKRGNAKINLATAGFVGAT